MLTVIGDVITLSRYCTTWLIVVVNPDGAPLTLDCALELQPQRLAVQVRELLDAGAFRKDDSNRIALQDDGCGHSNFMSMHFVTSPELNPELMMMQPRTFCAVLSLAHTA